MTAVLKLALPWEKYLAELLPAETPYSEDAIEYVAFCEYFPIEIGEAYGKWQEIVQNRIHKQVSLFHPVRTREPVQYTPKHTHYASSQEG